MKTLTNDVKLEEICDKNSYSIFLELGTFKKTSKVIDVILQDKVRKLNNYYYEDSDLNIIFTPER